MHCPGGGVRTEIARAVLSHLPRNRDCGERLSPVDFDIWIALVILEPDVELRAMLLDQVHLEDQRLEFGAYDDPFDIGDLAYQTARFAVQAGIRMKIRADAIAQVDGFSDVNHLRGRAPINITA